MDIGTSKDDPAHACRILVVEDERAVREALTMILEDEGYSVGAATDGADALQRLEGGERPCLILLDLMMPVMTGTEFLHEIGERPSLAEIPVILMTAMVGPPAAAVKRVRALVAKPFDIDGLLELVRGVC